MLDRILNYIGKKAVFVESSGTTDGWDWFKYSDGTAKCFKKTVKKLNFTRDRVTLGFAVENYDTPIWIGVEGIFRVGG